MLQLLIKACFLVCLLVYCEKNPTQWTNVKSRADAEKMAKIRSANNTKPTGIFNCSALPLRGTPSDRKVGNLLPACDWNNTENTHIQHLY